MNRPRLRLWNQPGVLPTPHVSATLIKADEGAADQTMGVFVIHGSEGWEERIAQAQTGQAPIGRRAVHCTSCGKPGHNSRSKLCPERGAQP